MATVKFTNLTEKEAHIFVEWYIDRGEDDARYWIEQQLDHQFSPNVKYDKLIKQPFYKDDEGNLVIELIGSKSKGEPKTMWRADLNRGPIEVTVSPNESGRYYSNSSDTICDSDGMDVWKDTHFHAREKALEKIENYFKKQIKSYKDAIVASEKSIKAYKEAIKESSSRLADLIE